VTLLNKENINWEEVKNYIQGGADPNAKNKNKWTALGLASY
jgi:ankyrin repeat protein